MKLWSAFTLVLALFASVSVSAEDAAATEVQGETHEFQAEVSRLMDIIINSLYTNREIFLRELISNAADASDKIRFEALKDQSLLGEGDLAELDVKIEFNKDDKTMTITDKGIGMTRDQLLKNLGVVAKSGTSEFLDAASKGEDKLSLIGQFGVGFYSVYLVADKVTVVSKHNDDKQYVWESLANSVYTIAEDPRGNTLGRGTSITLHLKEDAEEFLNEAKIKEIVGRYSQFVNFPIFVKTTKMVDKEVPIEEDEETEEEKGEDDIEVSDDEEEDEEEKPKTKTIKEKVDEWERINTAKALWTRDPKEVTEEEYKEFYMAFTKGKSPDGPADQVHFTAEGEISFRSLLYIPKKASKNQYSDLFSLKKSGVSLYVRRVLISDEFEDFLPRYLNFVKGVVDSDDLPLNVSRETLAQSRVLKVMSKKLVRKILELLGKMSSAAESEEEEEYEGEEPTEEEKEAAAAAKLEAKEAYELFWKEHGKSIKFGVIDDRKNKAKLTKLLRFKTSKSDGEYVSLASYIARMQEGQKYIYYVTGESLEKVKKSPFLEKLTTKDYEVVYMVDAVDEYLVNAMTEYDGMELQSVTKEGLKLGDEERGALKKLKEEYKDLTDWFARVYGKDVEKVAVSNRLGESPCVLVTSQYGWSANMQRIANGATLASKDQGQYMVGKKTFEINVMHPIIQSMNQKIVADADDQALKDMAYILMDAALMASGFPIQDLKGFYSRMSGLVQAGLGLDPDAVAAEEVMDAEEEEEEEGEQEEQEEEAVEAEEDADTEEKSHEEL